MTKLKHITLAAALVLGGIFPAGPAFADQATLDSAYAIPASAPQWQITRDHAAQQQYAQSRISAAEAKAAARQYMPGAQVVGISLEGNAYRVRMVGSDGRRIDVFVDAVTGRVR